MPPRGRNQGEALDAAGIGTWEWEIDSGRIWWSDNMEALHGLEPGSFDGTFESYLALMHPEDRPRVEEAVRKALSEEIPFHVEYREEPCEGHLVWIEGKGRVVRDESGQPVRMIGACLPITDRKRSERLVHVLAEAGTSVTQSLDYQTTLQNVADLVVPELADWCGVDLLVEGGEIQNVAVAHVDPKKVDRVREMRRRFPPRPHDPAGAGYVIRTGKAQLISEVSDELLQEFAEDEAHLEMLRTLGLRSGVVAPLVARGRTLGALTLVAAETAYRFSERDIVYVEELARQCALAVDNARLHERTAEELEERKDAELRLQSIVDHVVDGIITIDARGTIESFNPAAEEIFGYSRDEVTGRNVRTLMPEPDRSRHDEYIRRYLSTGEPRIIGIGREVAGMRKDGTTFPMELAVSEFEHHGERMFTGIVRDITERKEAEANLRASEARERERAAEIEALMDSVPAVVFLAQDPEGRKVTGNRQAHEFLRLPPGANLSRTAPSEERPEHFRLFQGGEEVPGEELPVQRAARGEIVESEELEVRFSDGTVKYLLSNARPIWDEDDRPRGSLAAMIDITRRKRIERELQELNERLEKRVASRTAELEWRARQLQRMTVELTQAEHRERRKLAQILHDDHQQVLVAIRMQTDALENAVPEALKPRTSRINKLVEEAVESSRSLSAELSPQVLYTNGLGPALHWLAPRKWDKYGLSVHVDADTAGEPVKEEVRVLLFDLVRELLLNVVKHAESDEAWVTLGPAADGQVELVVEDRGRGFDPEEMERDSEGTAGFGLSGMRDRLDAIGGTLHLDAEPGRGTRVTLRVHREADGGMARTEEGLGSKGGDKDRFNRSPGSQMP